jgi:hypothetical protein
MILGNRIGSPAVHGMWHSVWSGERWLEPSPVVSGPKVVDDIGGVGFDPSAPQIALSQGSTLLVTWRMDGSSGFNGVHSSFGELDAQELPVIPLPDPAGVVTEPDDPDTTELAAVLDNVADPVAVLPPAIGNEEPASVNNSSVSPLLVGILPVAALIGLVLLGRAMRRGR